MITFSHKAIKRGGKVFHLLTTDQYPYSNLQVVTFPPAEHDTSIAKLQQVYGSWVEQYPGRNDFAVIQAGGSSQPVNITQENYKDVLAAIRQCMQDAAAWWVEHEHDLKE